MDAALTTVSWVLVALLVMLILWIVTGPQ